MSHQDNEELVQWFLNNGAPADGLPSNPGEPLRWAVLCSSSTTVPALLLSRGAATKNTGALHAAAWRRDDELSIAMMGCLLDAGADIDELEYEDWVKLPRGASRRDWGTALHKAVREGSMPRVRLLIERGADVGKKSRNGYTARDMAQLYQEKDMVKYLEDVMRERGVEIVRREYPYNPNPGPRWRELD